MMKSLRYSDLSDPPFAFGNSIMVPPPPHPWLWTSKIIKGARSLCEYAHWVFPICIGNHMILIAIWDLEHKQIYQRLIKLHGPYGCLILLCYTLGMNYKMKLHSFHLHVLITNNNQGKQQQLQMNL